MYKDIPNEYEALVKINQKALERVWKTKGKIRHGKPGVPFSEQDICVLTREEGWGFAIGQARKKLNEAKRMFNEGDKTRAIDEVLDASIYLQALALVMEEEVLAVWDDIEKAGY